LAKILVTDGNYPHTLGIIRSLSSLGHDVDCIGKKFCLSFFSRYTSKCINPNYLFCESHIKNFLIFLRKEKYDFLIPIGAESIDLVNRHRKLISKEVIINLAPYKSILICLSKEKTLNLAKKKGLAIPKKFTNDFIKIFISNNNKLPCELVIKPKEEISNLKVKYISNVKDYLKDNFSSKNLLIQERIQGYGIGFFAIYDNGKLINFFMHRRLREYPASGGSSVLAQSIYDFEIYKKGKLLLDALNWHGVAMVEFKKDKFSGKSYLMEINPKFWGSHDLSISSGINFAEEYLYLSTKSKIKQKNKFIKYKLNQKFQWPIQDLFSNLFNPFVLPKIFIDLLDYSIQNNLFFKDPLPSLHMISYGIISPIMKSKLGEFLLNLLYKLKKFGITVTLIRLFTEITGIPILKFSMFSNRIAIGMQPKYLGYYYLKKNKFDTILNLRKKINKHNFLKNFQIKNIPIEEYSAPSIDDLNKGADYINKVIMKNRKIYIHCREGISRAPVFLAAYLIKYKEMELDQAIKKIKSRRNFIQILPNQKKSLANFLKGKIDLDDNDK